MMIDLYKAQMRTKLNQVAGDLRAPVDKYYSLNMGARRSPATLP